MIRRDEPHILADLIRMMTRWEERLECLDLPTRERKQLEEDHALVEQARAALQARIYRDGKKPIGLGGTYARTLLIAAALLFAYWLGTLA